MSLRDYFAGQAMVGYIGGLYSSMKSAELWEMARTSSGGSMPVCIAKGAYEFADAMLEERAK
jgi:hypothetical protein